MTCPRCGGPARRETDTMDTFVNSSWYFMRYTAPHLSSAPFERDVVDYWLPIDQYIGGIEHAVLHLLYARFLTKVLHDADLIGADEPFARLFTQGMIYRDGAKMSKSRGNVVAPDEYVERYGADTLRLYVLFMGPAADDAEWSDQGRLGPAALPRPPVEAGRRARARASRRAAVPRVARGRPGRAGAGAQGRGDRRQGDRRTSPSASRSTPRSRRSRSWSTSAPRRCRRARSRASAAREALRHAARTRRLAAVPLRPPRVERAVGGAGRRHALPRAVARRRPGVPGA